MRDQEPIGVEEEHHWVYYRFLIPVEQPMAGESEN
jgi:hypothetical protein